MRMAVAAALAALAAAGAASAQTQEEFERPYWLNRSVIEVIGRARVEAPANRARFSVTFQERAREAGDAQAEAADRARLATAAMRDRGGSDIEISSVISVEPIYEEYRDRDGNVQQREGAQNVTSYLGSVTLSVRILNTARASDVRAAALAVGPEASEPLGYYLEETAELQRQVYEAAVTEAAGRARVAARATGSTLGPLLVLQDGQGPCLGQWNSSPAARNERRAAAGGVDRNTSEEIVVTGIRGSLLRITAEDIGRFELPDDATPVGLNAQVCAVFGVGP
ncbi:MAG: SIMPL domain-containing protein [Terricaulis sp.]